MADATASATGFLTTKLGGVPAWAWAAGAGIMVGGFLYYRKSKGSQKGSPTGQTGATDLSASTLGGTSFPQTAVPIIIPSPTTDNTGLPTTPASANPTDSGASSSGTSSQGTAVPPPPAPQPPANPFLKNDPGGGWPNFVAGNSPETQLVEDLYLHYLGRPVESEAVMQQQADALRRHGYAWLRNTIMNSPEAKAFAANRQAQGLGVGA
jgi:hypothetical protein